MRFFPLRLFLLAIAIGCCGSAFTQETRTGYKGLIPSERELRDREQLLKHAKQKNWDTLISRPDGYVAKLVGVDGFGLPLYLATDNNVLAAATIGTTKLWPGGISGLNLSGSSDNIKGKVALWDGGRVRPTHVELAGRVTQKDGSTSNSDHATHVAGTMAATGINPSAKGMSFGLKELLAYDFGRDSAEMRLAAPNLLISNHSYGYNAGWNYNEGAAEGPRWEYLGAPGSTEDYKFGYYNLDAQSWDDIAFQNPNYLIVKSAGNSRNENGPSVGQPYWRYNSSGRMEPAGNRPAGISSNNGYDILSLNSTSKNILLVGAVNAIPGGYTRPQDVVISDFSSYGPTDDGRIKPDVVADGVSVFSCYATNDNAYATLSGTSMSSPNASGSLVLLQEYYSQKKGGSFMRSATLRGLVIHTADEAGTAPGPDYRFGWGLINMQKAAAVITNTGNTHLMEENVLANGATYTKQVVASGNGVITATICWTDPKGTVVSEAVALNNTEKKLINDLDIVIRRGSTVFQPWTLSPANPAAAATRGNNSLDNVEKIELTDVIPGETYTIEITHKGTLQSNQAYSLLVSGIGGQSYCTSAPASTAGARIDSVSIGNIRQKNAGNCTGYTNYTGFNTTVEQGQSLPLFIRLNSCDATSVGKIVKVFIDANNDGDFDDAGENVAVSGVINGNADYSANLNIPPTLNVNNFALLRIVMVETTNAAAVLPCGNYTKGETQDYLIRIGNPSIDLGITSLASPDASNCGLPGQYIAMRFRNNGTSSRTGFPVAAIVKQGGNTIATLNETFKAVASAGAEVTHTFQTPVDFLPGQNYTITLSVNLPQDQNTGNNTGDFTVSTRAATPAPAGSAEICNNTAFLRATAVASRAPYNWYSSAAAATPIATGTNTSTSNILPAYYLSSGEVNKLGAADKMVFPQGGYLGAPAGHAMKFTVTTPFVLKNAKMYIGSAGKLTFELRRIASESDSNYQYFVPVVSSTVVDVFDTSPNSNPTTNDPSDPGAVYTLNIAFPQAGDYYLAVLASEGATVFRNNNITTNPYPYTVPGVVTMPRSSAALKTDPDYGQKFYYFIYDMNIEVASCPSPRVAITPVTKTAPVITSNGNVLTSSAASNNQWYLNDNIIVGATGQTHTATTSGSYKTVVEDGNCTLTSNAINITITSVPNIDPAEIGMTVSPNPAPSGRFTLRLVTTTRSNLDIALMNTTGQPVYKEQIANFSGTFTKTIDPGKLAAGVYYLQVIHDKKSYIRKVVVLE